MDIEIGPTNRMKDIARTADETNASLFIPVARPPYKHSLYQLSDISHLVDLVFSYTDIMISVI
jgi:hypothetical protein